MSKLVILGAGGHGKVVADAALSSAQYQSIVFVDARYKELPQQLGLQVIGDDSSIPELIEQSYEFVVAIGDNRIRAAKFQELQTRSAKLAKIVHSQSVVSPFAEIQEGTVVLAGVKVNPDARIGQNVILNTGAIVEHDCQVGAHSHIAPGATLTGGCSVDELSLFGAGAVAIPNISIGREVVVGAGAIVVRNIPDTVTATGIPAKW